MKQRHLYIITIIFIMFSDVTAKCKMYIVSCIVIVLIFFSFEMFLF